MERGPATIPQVDEALASAPLQGLTAIQAVDPLFLLPAEVVPAEVPEGPATILQVDEALASAPLQGLTAIQAVDPLFLLPAEVVPAEVPEGPPEALLAGNQEQLGHLGHFVPYHDPGPVWASWLGDNPVEGLVLPHQADASGGLPEPDQGWSEEPMPAHLAERMSPDYDELSQETLQFKPSGLIEDPIEECLSDDDTELPEAKRRRLE